MSPLKKRPLPRSVWILSFVSFLADVSGEMMYPLLPLFLIGVLGSSKTQLGAMEGVAILIVSLMSAYAGIRSDRKGKGGGRVRWIRIGYGLPVLGKAIVALATVWPMVVFGRILDRFGKGLRGAPRDALIADAVSEEQRGRAFGLHRALDTAGALVGVLLAAFLLWWLTDSPRFDSSAGVSTKIVETPAWVYRAIFGFSSVLGLASLALTFFVHDAPAVTSETQRDSSVMSGGEESPTPNSIASKRSDRFHLPSSYWAVLGVLILFSLANSSDTFILLRARDLGYSSWSIVLVYALFNVTYSALSYPLGVLSDRIGRWKIIATGWSIYAASYVGFALLPNSYAWGMWPLMAFYGVYMALTDGINKALIADHAPKEHRGAAMGLFYALTGVTTLIASLLTGIVWDLIGPAPAMLLGAGFAMLALLALAILGRFVELEKATK